MAMAKPADTKPRYVANPLRTEDQILAMPMKPKTTATYWVALLHR